MAFGRLSEAQATLADDQVTVGRGHNYLATAGARQRLAIDGDPHRDL
jgi:hypothetical protein